MYLIRRHGTLREKKNWKLFFLHVNNLALKIMLSLSGVHVHVTIRYNTLFRVTHTLSYIDQRYATVNKRM